MMLQINSFLISVSSAGVQSVEPFPFKVGGCNSGRSGRYSHATWVQGGAYSVKIPTTLASLLCHKVFLSMNTIQVLYLGAASGTTVSHVSDVVGPEGMVYAVEFSHRFGPLMVIGHTPLINLPNVCST